MLVVAKAVDSIVGAFDPAESYETANNEACGNIYRNLIIELGLMPDYTNYARIAKG